jgi:hypothetical protein
VIDPDGRSAISLVPGCIMIAGVLVCKAACDCASAKKPSSISYSIQLIRNYVACKPKDPDDCVNFTILCVAKCSKLPTLIQRQTCVAGCAVLSAICLLDSIFGN